ncbi:hypothetical protein [Microcella alkaliphila]|uniref:NAD-dependent epimerase/dehydratase n=1 Tax=Microcella alkaliphila TaxID=279828 RepID=A0A0U5BP24_9MICO|nr:hypothetical protein [Microcella alkaliphila]BAU33301.1 NAD-dependent epimerase/dehydratase [Microcella alkaliphila]
MKIAIAGGHGKIARQLSRLLSAGGHEPWALIRNADHTADVENGLFAVECGWRVTRR